MVSPKTEILVDPEVENEKAKAEAEMKNPPSKSPPKPTVVFEDAPDVFTGTKNLLAENNQPKRQGMNGSSSDKKDEITTKISKFTPQQRPFLERVFGGLRRLLRIKDDFDRFAEYSSTVSDPDSKEDEAGQAYANMKPMLEAMKKNNPKAKRFVENYMRAGRLGAAEKGNLVAIQDLSAPDMLNNELAFNILNRVAKQNDPKKINQQRAALQSLKKYMKEQSSDKVEKHTGPYVKTLSAVMGGSRESETRLLAFQISKNLITENKLNQTETLELMNGIRPLLSYYPQALEEKAAGFIAETLGNSSFKGKQNYKKSIVSDIESKITGNRALKNLAHYRGFTIPALEKVAGRVKAVAGGEKARAFENGVHVIWDFFKDNEELVKKVRAHPTRIYREALGDKFKTNQPWQNRVKEMVTGVRAHWKQNKKEAMATEKALINLEAEDQSLTRTVATKKKLG